MSGRALSSSPRPVEAEAFCRRLGAEAIELRSQLEEIENAERVLAEIRQSVRGRLDRVQRIRLGYARVIVADVEARGRAHG